MTFTHKIKGHIDHTHEFAWEARACTNWVAARPARNAALADARLAVAQGAARHIDEAPTGEGQLELLIARYGAHQVKPGGTEAYDGEDSLGGVAEDVFWKRVYALREADEERRAYEAKAARDTMMMGL